MIKKNTKKICIKYALFVGYNQYTMYTQKNHDPLMLTLMQHNSACICSLEQVKNTYINKIEHASS